MAVTATIAPIPRRALTALGTADLQPGAQIEAAPENGPGAWRSTGGNPNFLIDGPLRAGWWRFQVRLRRLDNQNAERVQADLRADFGTGVDPGPPLERVVWNAELDERHIYVHLPRPATALSFQPLTGPGTVRVEDFSAQRLSKWGSLVTALRHKLRLLRDYNCTWRVLRRGLMMLFTGRLGEVYRKLIKALPDTRRYNPESDAYIRMIAGLGRTRVPSTRQERDCLRQECDELAARPTIAVILPVHDISPPTLLLSVESVLRQVYEQWELHLVLPDNALCDLISLAENYTERFDRARVTVGEAGGTIDDALTDVLDRVEADYLVFLQPGFELGEAALLRLMKTRQAAPECLMVLNQVPPPEEQRQRGLLSGSAFRPGAAGAQVNLYRTSDIRSLERLPSIVGSHLALGTEVARRLSANPSPPPRSGEGTDFPPPRFGEGQGRGSSASVAYYHEVLAFPISCLATVPAGPDEFVELGNPPRPIMLTANICGISGWDNMVFEVARGLQSLGANLRLNATAHHQADLLPPSLLPARRLRRDDDLELLMAPPHLLAHHPHPPGCVIFTMWESDRLEKRWVDDLNQAALVIVPSRWAVESFRASGVTVPIEVVPLGHDSLTFHADNGWPTVCTFGTAAALWGGGVRKNTQRLIAAFARAFPDEVDVRLRVKITPKCELPEPNDPRIEVLRKFLLPGELAEWYRSLTAYVNGSAAEGFGLHLVEAMACGRPVVSTAYSAVTEYFDDTVGFPVAHRLADAEGTVYQGQWADLDDDDLTAALRFIYANDADARRRGRHAATRTRRFTWKEAGRTLVQVLERHASDRLTV